MLVANSKEGRRTGLNHNLRIKSTSLNHLPCRLFQHKTKQFETKQKTLDTIGVESKIKLSENVRDYCIQFCKRFPGVPFDLIGQTESSQAAIPIDV